MKVQGAIEFTITERSEERVVSEMPVGAGIKNPFGVVHAGALLWMADVTATVLAMGPGRASEGMKGFPLAISLNANFLGSPYAIGEPLDVSAALTIAPALAVLGDEALVGDVARHRPGQGAHAADPLYVILLQPGLDPGAKHSNDHRQPPQRDAIYEAHVRSSRSAPSSSSRTISAAG